jgi:hypothetical protein
MERLRLLISITLRCPPGLPEAAAAIATAGSLRSSLPPTSASAVAPSYLAGKLSYVDAREARAAW